MFQWNYSMTRLCTSQYNRFLRKNVFFTRNLLGKNDNRNDNDRYYQTNADDSVFEDAVSEENIKATIERTKHINLGMLSKVYKDYYKGQSKGKNVNSPEKSESKVTNAAVLVPFCHNELNQPSVLFTLRSANLSNHRSQMSFPGGIEEAHDNNEMINTAVRETVEELGINQERIKAYGMLNPIPMRSSAAFMYPVLAYVDLKNINYNLNHDEVECVFLAQLKDLCCDSNWRMTAWTYGWTTPAYIDPNKDMPRVWGLTALTLHITLRGLLPTKYKTVLNQHSPLLKKFSF